MPLRMAQIGTGHGHAAGKVRAMLDNPSVELVGVFEPDPTARDHFASTSAYAGTRWLDRIEDILANPSVVAVAVEGRNDGSLSQARAAASAGKHLWYDKPAGDDWTGYRDLIATVRARHLHLQMGYMFRYHSGFNLVAAWALHGLLGDLFSVRAHMSTWIPTRAVGEAGIPAFTREVISHHRGGIFYDLAGHMLDQIILLMGGRPRRVTGFFRNDATPELPAFCDNSLAVFEFERGLATVDIAAMEARPAARRFEVYGTRGSAILEPLEPATSIRLHLDEAGDGFASGETIVPIAAQSRQELYGRELVAFVARVRGETAPDRSLDHEILVQETLLRATGEIPASD